MEFHAMVQMKDIRAWIRDLPTFGEPRFDTEVLVALQQVIEDQVVDSLRRSVNAHSRIQIGGAALDDHH